MIDRITNSIAVGVDRATKKAADAIENVSDRLEGKSKSAVDNAVLVRLNSAYSENFLQARNEQDSISYLQTREGALGQLGSSLQELRDIAVGMGNPILNESDKELLASQANAIVGDISSLTSNSKFNDHSVIGDAGPDALGLSGFDITSSDAISKIDGALSVVNSKRAETGAGISTMEARIDNLAEANINLAEAAEGYSGSLLEDITDLNLAVTQAMVSTKALDAVIDLNKEKVMSLIDVMNPVKSR
jgi:flagellin